MDNKNTQHLFLALLLVLTASPAAADRLTVGGVGASLGTIRQLADAFQQRNPTVTIEVLPSLGSSGGIMGVAEGALDIGLAARPQTEREMALGLRQVDFALTPLVFLAHPSAEITNIERAPLLSCLSGANPTWPNGQRCRPVVRPGRDSETIILSGVDAGLGAALQEAATSGGVLVTLTSQDNVDAVERIPGSLGYTTLALLKSEQRALPPLSYAGTAPSLDNLARGVYPFAARLYAVTRPAPSAVAERFLDFFFSAAGRAILKANGSLPLPPP